MMSFDVETQQLAQKFEAFASTFEELSKITGYNQKPVYMPAPIGSINRNVLDNSKIKKFYYPDIDLKTGLSKLVKNYMEIKI